jgi:hypothetical protein
VLDTMRPRLERARTRRRASIAGAIGGAAAVVIVVLLVLGGGGGGDGAVRTPPASNGPVVTTPTAPTTPTTTAGGGSVDDDARPDDRGADDAASPVTPTVPDAGGVSTATSTPADSTPITQAAFDRPYSSAGGSIVVHFENGQVSLVSSSPASGFSAEVHDNGPTRVEVRFSSGQTEWRIRVDVVDGQLQSETTQHG